MDRIDSVAKKVGDTSVEAGRGSGQLGWYKFASNIFKNMEILDAGCGLGKGLEILRQSNNQVTGQDLDPRIKGEKILITPLKSIHSNSFDIVTSIDVVEHVENDKEFISDLVRIAKYSVFITTPNWTISRCQWPYHLREYTPEELEKLLKPYGTVKLFKGNFDGTVVYPIEFTKLYHIANKLRAYPITSFVTRCINRLLPKSWRICGHNAALLEINQLNRGS